MRPLAIRVRSLLLASLCLVGATLGCGPSEPAKNPRFDLAKRRGQPSPSASPELSGPPGLPSVVIAELATESTEVHFARNANRGLLLARKGGRWLTGPVVVDQEDAVPGDQPEMKNVAPAPAERGPLAFVPAGDGFLLAWSRPSQAGDEIWTQALTVDGEADGEPQRVEAGFPAIRWVDAMVADDGRAATLVWEVQRGATRDLYVAAWSGSGVGSPQRVAEDVVGWHAVGGVEGAGLVWVSGRGERGTVRFSAIGPSGKPGATVELSPSDRALADVQIARVKNGYLVAWTDESAVDPHVWLAPLQADGKLARAPEPAVPPVGGQTLIALVGAEDRSQALLAWEHSPASAAERRVQLTTLEPAGKRKARAALELHGDATAPHLVADGSGFAALTLAPLRHAASPPASGGDPLGPVFLRLDAGLGVRSTEPIRVAALADQSVGVAGVPAQVHGLICQKGVCSLLATGSGEPALLALVGLPLRDALWRAPAERLGPVQPPEATSLEALASVDAPLADLDSARLADGRTIVAWVTHHTGTPGAESRGPAPPGATLAFRFIEADGSAGKVQVISDRAISIGGVDVEALPASDKAVAVIGWAGPNNRASQVYLTKIDKRGDKLRQKTLTKVNRPQKSDFPNEVYDVSIAVRDDGGVVCSWADTRDGNPEIYVARANTHLERRERERRITENDTMSVEPAVTIAAGRVFLLWTEGQGGDSDLFLQTLDPDKLIANGPPSRLHDATGRTRAPAWVGREAGALAASWIEENAEAGRATLHLVALDDGGKAVTAVRDVTLAATDPITSATIRCTSERCRGLLTGLEGSLLHLGAFETRRDLGGPIRAKPLLTLPGGTAQDVSLRGVGTSLDLAFFVRDRQAGSVIRRLRLRW